jgi:hypothetical protein
MNRARKAEKGAAVVFLRAAARPGDFEMRSSGAVFQFGAAEAAGVGGRCPPDARSPAMHKRVSIHEAGHVAIFRYYDLPVAGATIVAKPGCYDGLTWHEDLAAARSTEPSDYSAIKVTERLRRDLPGPGEAYDGALFADIETQLISLMAGPAAEAVVFEDESPMLMASDVGAAHAIARVVCRSETSCAALIEHAYQESVTLCREHKPVIVALATALSDKKTLFGSEIDLIISQTLAVESIKAEHARRRQWSLIEQNAAMFERIREQTDCLPDFHFEGRTDMVGHRLAGNPVWSKN